ncbi:hypothetical protein [Methylobacterium soli]|uniref:Toxin-antitoxin system HicB family antitoxin n=1 Tax=Methylobacterium soli TaxID=553447 RepID=A0A6L3SRX2_9HYPH|nr:hypothetical protein [Methylobacterium soli]KAB1075896.1 hypothetical protein F6X53_23995 [Methylobacterium soli]
MALEEKKTAIFQVRMRPSVKAAGEKAAAAESRSLASLMEWLLIEHLQAKGMLGRTPNATMSNEPHLATGHPRSPSINET